MNTNIELKILSRLLKERQIFNKIKDNLINYDGFQYFGSYMKCIDEIIDWRSSKEGYNYWYFLQLDYVKLLIIFDKCDLYIQYYKILLSEYGDGSFIDNNHQILKEHEMFAKSLNN